MGRCLWEGAGATPAPAPTPLPDRVDVAVVGGGYTGLAAARGLARSGAGVVVLEQHRIGWGASGRNGGFVLPGFQRGLADLAARLGEARAGELYRMSLAAVRGLESLMEAERIACDYARCGALLLAARPGHLRGLEAERRCLARVGSHETRVLGAGELGDEIGSRAYHGGLLDGSAGALHPGRLCAGLAAAARRAGAAIHEETAVTAIRGRPGAMVLATNAGPLRADEVVVATDGYTGAPFARLRRRIVPVGSYLVATAPLDPGLAGRLMPRGRVMSDTRNLLHYFRLSPDRRMLFGGRASMVPLATARAAGTLGGAMRRIFPDLATAPLDYAWSGAVGFTRDRLPHAGRLDGVHYALGYCGHGVAFAVWLGGRMAEALGGGSALPDLGPLRAFPLYGGRPWFLPFVDAYYRVRDRFD